MIFFYLSRYLGRPLSWEFFRCDSRAPQGPIGRDEHIVALGEDHPTIAFTVWELLESFGFEIKTEATAPTLWVIESLAVTTVVDGERRTTSIALHNSAYLGVLSLKIRRSTHLATRHGHVFPHLPPNDCLHLPGRLARRGVAQNQNGGQVRCKAWFGRLSSSLFLNVFRVLSAFRLWLCNHPGLRNKAKAWPCFSRNQY